MPALRHYVQALGTAALHLWRPASLLVFMFPFLVIAAVYGWPTTPAQALGINVDPNTTAGWDFVVTVALGMVVVFALIEPPGDWLMAAIAPLIAPFLLLDPP